MHRLCVLFEFIQYHSQRVGERCTVYTQTNSNVSLLLNIRLIVAMGEEENTFTESSHYTVLKCQVVNFKFGSCTYSTVM